MNEIELATRLLREHGAFLSSRRYKRVQQLILRLRRKLVFAADCLSPSIRFTLLMVIELSLNRYGTVFGCIFCIIFRWDIDSLPPAVSDMYAKLGPKLLNNTFGDQLEDSTIMCTSIDYDTPQHRRSVDDRMTESMTSITRDMKDASISPQDNSPRQVGQRLRPKKTNSFCRKSSQRVVPGWPADSDVESLV